MERDLSPSKERSAEQPPEKTPRAAAWPAGFHLYPQVSVSPLCTIIIYVSTRPCDNLEYRKARTGDLERIARVMLEAFPESVEHYVGRRVEPAVMADVFAIALDAEPEALMVGVCDGEIAGYIYAPPDLSRVFKSAITRGHLPRMIWRWLTGR